MNFCPGNVEYFSGVIDLEFASHTAHDESASTYDA